MNAACEMRSTCAEPVTHVGEKGYIYCAEHAAQRRGYERVRKLRPAELRRIDAGERVKRF